MFKVCIAVILQILQFSTDERTLEAMKGLSGYRGLENAVIEPPMGRSGDPILFHSSGDAVLILPKGHVTDAQYELLPFSVKEMQEKKVVFA